MQIVYTGEEMPEKITKSIFLAGPTPRNRGEVESWRPDALKILEDIGYDGVVFVPEGRDGQFKMEYDDQIGWEEKYLNVADCIVFWVPRDISHDSTGYPKMPAFTTNVEWGTWADTGKVVFGAPENADKIGYLRHYAAEYNAPIGDTLTETLQHALNKLGNGAERSGGERYVPLFIWKQESFQEWYQAQKGAGNTLEDARLLYSFRPKFKDYVFMWVLLVNIYIADEDRYKKTEVVISRPSTSSVMLWHKTDEDFLRKWEIVLIREFRSPASTPDGFIHELPSGALDKGDPEENAAAELHEETGFYLDPSRLVEHQNRQLAGTFSAHKSHLFSVELDAEEIEWFKSQKDIPHGVEKDTERTYVEVVTIGDILENNLVDWSTLGMIFEVIATRRVL